MITKEKIIEILSNYSSYADSSLGNIIQEEKHDIIAEDILSKLRQPLVSGSVADAVGRNCPFCGEPCVECSHKATER